MLACNSVKMHRYIQHRSRRFANNRSLPVYNTVDGTKLAQWAMPGLNNTMLDMSHQ